MRGYEIVLIRPNRNVRAQLVRFFCAVVSQTSQFLSYFEFAGVLNRSKIAAADLVLFFRDIIQPILFQDDDNDSDDLITPQQLLEGPKREPQEQARQTGLFLSDIFFCTLEPFVWSTYHCFNLSFTFSSTYESSIGERSC